MGQAEQEKQESDLFHSFVVTLNHEFNSPLTALLLSAQALQKTELSAEQEKYLSIILSSASKLKSLLKHMHEMETIKKKTYIKDISMIDIY